MWVRFPPGVPCVIINKFMKFDGYTKKICKIDTNLILPVAEKLKSIDWNHDNYSRNEPPLIKGKLIELPFIIINNTDNKLDEHSIEIINLCKPIIEFVQQYFPNHLKIRGEVVTLLPGNALDYHIDPFWFHANCHRIHIPIVTNNECVQLWAQPYYHEHLEVGYVYEINNCIYHSAENKGKEYRTHIVMDVCDKNLYMDYVVDRSGTVLDWVWRGPVILPKIQEEI